MTDGGRAEILGVGRTVLHTPGFLVVLAVRILAMLVYVLGMHVVPIAHAYTHHADCHVAVDSVSASRCSGCCQNHYTKPSPSPTASEVAVHIDAEPTGHHCKDECQLCQVLTSTIAFATFTPGFTITVAEQEAFVTVKLPEPIDLLLYVPAPRGPPCA